MPHRCDPCDRNFAHKEALQAHLKSSSLEHPFCSICDRRFNCQSARDMHMANKHPPTFDCESCNRTFKSPAALQSHYRGHASHPNCARCGRGFKDFSERDQHQRSCDMCPGIMLCEDTLKSHYHQSPNHPDCPQCEQGFRDDKALEEHISTEHPPNPEPQPESENVVADPRSTQAMPALFPTPPEPPLQPLAPLSPQLGQLYATSTTPLSSPPQAARPDVATSPRINDGFPAMIPPSLRAHIDVAASMRQDTSSPALFLPKKYAAQIKDEQTPLFSPLSALPPPESVPPGVWQSIPGPSTGRVSSDLPGGIQPLHALSRVPRPSRPLSDGAALQMRTSSWRRPLPVIPNEIPLGRTNDQGLSNTQISPPRNLWAERSAMQAASLSGPSRPIHPTLSGIPVPSLRNTHAPTSSFPTYQPGSIASYPAIGRNRGFSLPRSNLSATMEENTSTTGSNTPLGPAAGMTAWGIQASGRRTSLGDVYSGNIPDGRDVMAMTQRLLAPGVGARAESGSSTGLSENPWHVRLPASPPSTRQSMPWAVRLPSSHASGSTSPGMRSPEVFSPFDLPPLPPPPSIPGMSPMLMTPSYSFNNSQQDIDTTGLPSQGSLPPSLGGEVLPLRVTQSPTQSLGRIASRARSQSRSPRQAEEGHDTQVRQDVTASDHTQAIDTQAAAPYQPSDHQESPSQNQNGPLIDLQSEAHGIESGHRHSLSLCSPRTSTHSASASVLDSIESVPTSFDAMMDSSDEAWGDVMEPQPHPDDVQPHSEPIGTAPNNGSPIIPMAAFYTPESASARVSPLPEPKSNATSQPDVRRATADGQEADLTDIEIPAMEVTRSPTPETMDFVDGDKRPIPTRTSTLLTLTPPRPSLHIHSPLEPGTAISERGAGLSALMTPAETFASPRVHCRMCKSDPCIEMTATMCGHVFCYRCITKHVMEKSECPVCQTPTLLYCLFRLHLYS